MGDVVLKHQSCPSAKAGAVSKLEKTRSYLDFVVLPDPALVCRVFQHRSIDEVVASFQLRLFSIQSCFDLGMHGRQVG